MLQPLFVLLPMLAIILMQECLISSIFNSSHSSRNSGWGRMSAWNNDENRFEESFGICLQNAQAVATFCKVYDGRNDRNQLVILLSLSLLL